MEPVRWRFPFCLLGRVFSFLTFFICSLSLCHVVSLVSGRPCYLHVCPAGRFSGCVRCSHHNVLSGLSLVTLASHGLRQRCIVGCITSFVVILPLFVSLLLRVPVCCARFLECFMCMFAPRLISPFCDLFLVAPPIGFFPNLHLHPWSCVSYIRAICQFARQRFCCSTIGRVSQLHFLFYHGALESVRSSAPTSPRSSGLVPLC